VILAAESRLEEQERDVRVEHVGLCYLLK